MYIALEWSANDAPVWNSQTILSMGFAAPVTRSKGHLTLDLSATNNGVALRALEEYLKGWLLSKMGEKLLVHCGRA
jgi:hypothetical protein